MARKLTWFPWDVVRCETDEDWKLMSDEERGLFIRLLNHSWLNDGLPENPDDLARLIGKSLDHPKWARRVCRKFAFVGDRLVNKTQEEFRARAKEKSRKATDSVRTRYVRNSNEPARASDSCSKILNLKSSSSEGGVEETKLATESGFKRWWAKWSAVRGTAYQNVGCTTYISLVPNELEQACLDCTDSYFGSLENPARGGYRPDNFLIEMARDKFGGRFPPFPRSGHRDYRAEKRAAEDEQFRDHMMDLAKRKGIA